MSARDDKGGEDVRSGHSAATITERKRAYRYKVIDHGGEGTKAIGDSPIILDWKYLGKEYTWNIFGGPKFEPLGFITGRYMDKGYLEDGQYVSDADAKAASHA